MTDKPFIHSHALVETGNIGKRTRIWAFAHIMPNVTIGEDCNFGDHSFVESDCTIGNRVTVKNGVSVWKGVTLEDDVFVGPNAVFTNDVWPKSRQNKMQCIETRVQRGVTIGANATIVCGNKIGKYAFIGAGSLVCRDVPDHALVYGNPAVQRGHVCVCRKKLRFHDHKAQCDCGKKYEIKSDAVREV